MPIPPSVTKIDKNGIQFVDNVDAVQYTIKQLISAALRDTGKVVTKIARDAAPRSRVGHFGKPAGTGKKAIRARNKKGEDGEFPHLRVGIEPSGFYMGFQELGSNGLPKTAMITKAVEQNIDLIRETQGKYLSAIADANQAAALAAAEENEGEEIDDDD